MSELWSTDRSVRRLLTVNCYQGGERQKNPVLFVVTMQASVCLRFYMDLFKMFSDLRRDLAVGHFVCGFDSFNGNVIFLMFEAPF